MRIKGIHYLTNPKGVKTAVVIDLKEYKEQIEDFLDGLEAASRVEEPNDDFEKAVNRIIKSKSRSGLSRQNKKVR